jgi:septal ring factor EnvC (AmiA/AmiB activator)
MEFIVGEQARSAARLGQLEDIVVRFAPATRDRFEANDQRADELDAKIAALVDAQMRTEENVRKTEENVRKTEENVRKTDESLRNLMAVVDRYFNGGRNGNSTK